MSLSPTITVSPITLGSLGQLQKLAYRLGIEMRDIGVHNAHLYAKALLAATPPLGKAMKINENAGKRAIAKDLAKITKEVSAAEFNSTWPISGGADVAFKDKRGNVLGVERTHWITNAAQLDPIHQRARRKSDGRVSDAGQYTSKRGRWRYIDRAVVETSVLREYLARVYYKLGTLASGWLTPLKYYSGIDKIIEGRDGQGGQSTPPFVSRHPSGGSHVNTLKPDGGGYATGTQPWRYGSPAKMAGILSFVTRKRQADMNGSMVKRLSKHVKDYNSGKVVYA